METCVLIPQEFALAVTGVGARHSPEQTATVWSSVAIPQGRLCYPFQGTVRIDNLAIFSALPEDDVSSSRHATPASACAEQNVQNFVHHHRATKAPLRYLYSIFFALYFCDALLHTIS
uniref:Uncharacterized protein n=1 Tax=Anopheles melas TaxID=34690 RepID=A0A182U899_9DIPT